MCYTVFMIELQFFVNAIFALLVGGIFFMRDDTPRGMEDRYVCCMVIAN